jgi:hypothetical protein
MKLRRFKNEKFSGLLIKDIFNAQQKDLICCIFSPPSSYPLIITVHLILSFFPFHRKLYKMSCISFITRSGGFLLLSQYADDSSLVLEDDPQSLDNSIKLVHKFTECAGLRINIDKTEAI